MRKIIFITLFMSIISCSMLNNRSSNRTIASGNNSTGMSCSELLARILDAQNDLSSEERQVLSRLMGKMQEIMGENVYGISDDLAFKMDSVFTAELEKIKLLNPDQLQDLEKIISRSQKSVISNLLTGAHVKDIGSVEKMVIEMNAFFANHPTTRIIMWHELDHVVDGILKNSFRTKRLETSAFSAQYDYTRKVFSVADLEELKDKFPTDVPSELVERLKDAGAIKVDGNKTTIQGRKSWANTSKIKIRQSFFVDYLKRSALNAFFIESVESALNMSKADFLKTRLKPYRGAIFRDRVSDVIKYGVGAISAYYIYHELADDD